MLSKFFAWLKSLFGMTPKDAPYLPRNTDPLDFDTPPNPGERK